MSGGATCAMAASSAAVLLAGKRQTSFFDLRLAVAPACSSARTFSGLFSRALLDSRKSIRQEYPRICQEKVRVCWRTT